MSQSAAWTGERTTTSRLRQVTDDLARDDVPAPQGLEELVLAVALEPGQADQLAGVDLEVDRPAVGAQPQAAHAQHRRAAAGRALAASPGGRP